MTQINTESQNNNNPNLMRNLSQSLTHISNSTLKNSTPATTISTTFKDFISCPMNRKRKSEFWFQVPDNR
jgi:hypothetical protein